MRSVVPFLRYWREREESRDNILHTDCRVLGHFELRKARQRFRRRVERVVSRKHVYVVVESVLAVSQSLHAIASGDPIKVPAVSTTERGSRNCHKP